MSKNLIILGCVIIAVGLFWPWLQKIPLGRLPGDIMIKRESFRLYMPITSCLLVSVILWVIFWFFKK